MKHILALLLCLATAGAWGQSINNPPGVPVGGNVSTNTVTATGGTLTVSLGQWLASFDPTSSGYLSGFFASDPMTYGNFRTAVSGSFRANCTNCPPEVMGWNTPSGVSAYASRDSVALYIDNTSPNDVATVSSGVTYSTTQVFFATPLTSGEIANLRIGMLIDTNDTTKYTGTITGWAINGSSITVSGWFQQGNAAAGQTPSGSTVYINPTLKIWAQNSNVTLTPLSSTVLATSAAGYEMGVINNQAALTPNSNPSLATPAMWGYDAVNLGTYSGFVGFIARDAFYYGFAARGNQQAAFASLPGGVDIPTYDFLSNSATGTPFASIDPTTGNTLFSVTKSNVLNLGQGTTSAVINLYGETSGGAPLRDGQILGASGGVLALRANTIQLADSTSNAIMVLANGASFVNYTQVQGNTTGNAPQILAMGSDTNVSLSFAGKGTGSVIVPSSKVGFGTSTPGSALEVWSANASGAQTAIYLVNPDNVGAAGPSIVFGGPNNGVASGRIRGSLIGAASGGTGRLVLGSISSGVANDELQLYNGGVGIGTSSPAAKFEVNGSVQFDSTVLLSSLPASCSGISGTMQVAQISGALTLC
jgi:hypothetical protein